MMTNIATVKARLGIASFETAQDALLGNFIRFVSERFEMECNRRFLREAAASFDFPAENQVLAVDRYPVERIEKFFLKTDELEGWIEQSPVSHVILAARAVIELPAPLGFRGQIGRIIFSGGYVAPGTALAEGQWPLPADLEQAVVEQVAYLFENRNRLGLISVGGGSGAIDILQALNLIPPSGGASSGSVWFKFAQIDLLPGAQAILRKYTRLSL